MLTVLDIGIGNIGSVTNVLKHLGYTFKIAKCPDDINDATKIIFPGVGSYSEGSKIIHEQNYLAVLKKKAIEDKIPFLGICLGMQLLTATGFENGESPGLGFVKGTVKPIELEDKSLVVPHMGWNDVKGDGSKVFTEINDGECFYFVHSYECHIDDPEVSIGYTNHGKNIVASFSKGNIYGAQFHPEKSQDVGLKYIRNFVNLC